MLDWNEDWKPTLPYSVTNCVHANPKSQKKSDPCGAGPEGAAVIVYLWRWHLKPKGGMNKLSASRQSRELLGQGALLLGCYCSCNLTGKAGSTTSQSRTFQGWPADHVTLTILYTQVPLSRKSEHTRECSQGNHAAPPLILHLKSQVPSNACISVSLAPFRNLSNLATKPRTSTATS